MNEPLEQNRSLRWSIYGLLIAVSVGATVGRIFAVNDDINHRPFLSGNDRSRWCTIRALVEEGTYEIDTIVREPGWDTIDMVQHRNSQGQVRLYSSKPPLMPTLMAGLYWPIHRLTGATLGKHPYDIGRAMLIVVNVLPLILYFVTIGWLVERLGTTDWGRIFAMAVATLATFLNTFAIVLNNHLPAAICVAITMYAVVKIRFDEDRRGGLFFLAGLAAAFTAANELPALSFLVAVAVGLTYVAPWKTLVAFTLGVAVVVAAFFGTNYLAHDTWRPPYSFRSKTDPAQNWYVYKFEDRLGRLRESYWTPGNQIGIDNGEPCRGRYAFHVLLGHHGVFSLTPVWLLSVVGLGIWFRRGPRPYQEVALLILSLTVVCLLFYIFRPEIDRNYGGVCAGFRWMFWFIPLWVLALIPTADALASGRALWRWGALGLLGMSVLSVNYAFHNPWIHPWIYQFMENTGTL